MLTWNRWKTPLFNNISFFSIYHYLMMSLFWNYDRNNYQLVIILTWRNIVNYNSFSFFYWVFSTWQSHRRKYNVKSYGRCIVYPNWLVSWSRNCCGCLTTHFKESNQLLDLPWKQISRNMFSITWNILHWDVIFTRKLKKFSSEIKV